MVDNPRHFKLIVKSTGKSTLRILRYFDEEIQLINRMGIRIVITKITDDDLTKSRIRRLREIGVKKFPALVPDKGRVRLGSDDIEELFEGNKASYQQHLRQNVRSRSDFASSDFGNTPELAQMYQSEMSLTAKKMDENRPEDNSDWTEGGKKEDFNRRISDFTARRRAQNTEEMDRAMDARFEAPKSQTVREARRMPTAHVDNIPENPLAKQEMTPMPPPRSHNIDADPSDDKFDDSMFDRTFTQNLDYDEY